MDELIEIKERARKLIARSRNVRLRPNDNQDSLDRSRLAFGEFAAKIESRHRDVSLENRIDILVTLNDLCQTYLQATPRQRSRIRRTMGRHRAVLEWLVDYVNVVNVMLKVNGEVKWLERALAAISIQDQGIDFRQTYFTLAALYIAAVDVGIEPEASFKAIASISNSKVNRPHAFMSTREYLGDFRGSGFFEEMVQPKLEARARSK